MFCDAIQDLACVWHYEENRYCYTLSNKQTLIDEYAINLNKSYEQELLFDIYKLKLKLNANSKFDNSFPRLRKLFDFNMAKLKSMALKKVSRISFVAGALSSGSSTSNEALRRHTVLTRFYGIDNAVNEIVWHFQ
ncbi:hypothetical protein niasHT_015088 [Heterodera trifolii]|uniref:Uncharacterized protein n=1 Tax=Heterodera trifolii TaxID=157864 RepID=A0ABD2L9H0_9BILA